MKPLCFMGNIGCGKSTWANQLSSHGYLVASENLNTIKYLDNYWKYGTHAFHTQVEFYATWLDLYYQANQKNRHSIIDSSIISHHMIFSTYMNNHKIISADEFFVCEQLYSAISSVIDCKTVYLYCNIEELYRRAMIRNRPLEKHQMNFLIEIEHMFKKVTNNLDIPKIDISNKSPNSPEDYIEFVNVLNGLKLI